MASVAYHVDAASITTETRLNGAGTGIEDVHVIPYIIDAGPARGLRRVVKVPENQFTTEGVKAAIEQDLATVHAIAGIGNPMGGM